MVLYSPFSNRTDGSGYNYLLRYERKRKERVTDRPFIHVRTCVVSPIFDKHQTTHKKRQQVNKLCA